ncbi:MAG: undecaprenyl pyrophosphate synthetase, partial [Actinomycetota bacterium]
MVEFLEASEEASETTRRFNELLDYLMPLYQREGKSYVTVAVGCTGGKHRSVALANAIGRHLYLPDLPPVDVLVRTSGEQRISNFMLWQSTGTEVYFTEKPWPEFDGA